MKTTHIMETHCTLDEVLQILKQEEGFGVAGVQINIKFQETIGGNGKLRTSAIIHTYDTGIKDHTFIPYNPESDPEHLYKG